MPDSSPLEVYESLFDTLMGHHYAAADSLCASIDRKWPGHPATDYGRASVIYAQLCDFEDTTGTAELERFAENCIEGCEQWERRNRDSAAAEREYLEGAAYSVSGLIRHKQGRTLDGIRRLMASRRHFDRAIEIDPEFYDAYVGRGAYRYAAATNLSLLRWLPGVPTKRQGWSDLEIGASQSKFSRYAAISAMVWFVLDDEKYELADSMVKAGLARFPDSRSFLIPKLSLEKKTGQWEDARQTALNLLNQFQHLPFDNGYEEIGLYRTLMDCSDMLGDSAAAEDYARLGLQVEATPYALDRRDDTLDALRARLNTEQSR
ncbi:MAG: hypothetical protein KDB65_03585 [Calditrichaeota bacterium]|nr:hypothetical protein [Calditrichota bacterium]MCB9368744.1 hypothetical protein [Calditrichota bacterium]